MKKLSGRSRCTVLPVADRGLVRVAVLRRDLAFAAQNLDALVVAVGGLAAVVDRGDDAVSEAQHDHRGVHVAGPPISGSTITAPAV